MNVLRTRSAGRAVDRLDRQARRRYDSAVEELRGRGCAAGGYRLLGDTGAADTVVIVSVAQHTADSNPHEALAAVFPGLSAAGRRRSAKPPCCEDSAQPPQMSDEARAILEDVLGL